MDNSTIPARGQQLLVFRPQQLVDAQVLIRAVKGNQAVVLDASSADACGGMEAIDGQVHRIDAETFLFSPAQGRVEHLPLSA
jgi:FtsZ-interacting cell division protein YlmF